MSTIKTASSLACVVLVLAAASGTAVGQSSLALGPLFQDHAVLQRDRPIPVWGTGGAGEEVSVALAAGGPFNLEVRTGSGTGSGTVRTRLGRQEGGAGIGRARPSGLSPRGNTPASAPATTRTVYVTAVDNQGHAVPGLAPSDFVVKEGGREHEILSVAPAWETMRLALMVEYPLVGAADVRQGLADFVTRMVPAAEIALYMISQRAEKLVHFTSSLNALVDGIRNLPLSHPSGSGAVPDAIFEVAKQIEKEKPARPVIVLVTTERGLAVGDPEYLLSQIANSKAQFWAVSVETAGSASLSQGLRVPMSLSIADALQQSGGRRVPILTLPGFRDGLQQVADDLSSQYFIVYALPAGVRPSERISVSLKKPGVTLRAPSRVPR